MKTQKQLITTCPNCKKSLIWSTDNPYRPFCSERCKQIDLGNWANEGYCIPVSDNDEQNDDQHENE